MVPIRDRRTAGSADGAASTEIRLSSAEFVIHRHALTAIRPISNALELKEQLLCGFAHSSGPW
jgi:hypothetical protein